jgi:hypothetical protein
MVTFGARDIRLMSSTLDSYTGDNGNPRVLLVMIA